MFGPRLLGYTPDREDVQLRYDLTRFRVQRERWMICFWARSRSCNRWISTWRAGAFAFAASAAATPAAWPAIIYCGSMRNDAYAMLEAEIQEVTSRFSHWPRFGRSAR